MKLKNEKKLIIGISGGSCSGKTTFARELQQSIGKERCIILSQDWYYFDQSVAFKKDPNSVNFDDPLSIDFDLMYKNLLDLISNKKIFAPNYDFVTHTQIPQKQPLLPKSVVVLDGTLIFSQPKIVSLLDYLIFLDTQDEVRLERRLNRDRLERGRNYQEILSQFTQQVRPMHQIFVEPYKHLAHYLITDSISSQKALNYLIHIIQTRIAS